MPRSNRSRRAPSPGPAAVPCGIAALLLTLLAAVPVHGEPPPLIPREAFFGTPEKASPGISPDGTRLAYLGGSADGIANIWVRTLGADDDTMLTAEKTRGVPFFAWAPDGKQILYFLDRNGDGNTHLFSLDVATAASRELTPFPGVRAQDLIVDPRHPREVLVAMNRRDLHLFDVHRVTLKTGGVRLDTQNPGDVIAWTADRSLVVRAATALDAKNGDTVIRVRDSAGAPWRDLARWPFAEAGNDLYQRIISFSRGGDSLLVQTPLGTNTTRLAKLDIKTGREGPTIAEDPRCDIWNLFGEISSVTRAAVMLDPKTDEPQAVAFEYIQPEWKVLDPAVKEDMNNLYAAHRGVPFVASRDADDEQWIAGYIVDNEPVSYYLYDRRTKKSSFLFTDRPALAEQAFPEAQPLVLRARDGLELVSYLTLPADTEPRNLPMILLVHGGPWRRDSWGFDPQVQWLANRGYAVLQVNYRGSSGFGKIHLNAGNGQWGEGSIQSDLEDAVAWASSDGGADPDVVGIVGEGYGGYAVLAGLAFVPGMFACGVDVAGPSDVKSRIESLPAYDAPRIRSRLLRIGDVIGDVEMNRRISPRAHLEAVEAPLLIAHGARDPWVPLAQSATVVEGMRALRLPVTFIVYPDEGEDISRPANKLDFFGRMEEFLAKYLYGRAEPWVAVPGSSGEER
jgi:dipeptidyl aminopeptidase/acylaminoacyl peptidase